MNHSKYKYTSPGRLPSQIFEIPVSILLLREQSYYRDVLLKNHSGAKKGGGGGVVESAQSVRLVQAVYMFL